jgi:hypothetical protein
VKLDPAQGMAHVLNLLARDVVKLNGAHQVFDGGANLRVLGGVPDGRLAGAQLPALERMEAFRDGLDQGLHFLNLMRRQLRAVANAVPDAAIETGGRFDDAFAARLDTLGQRGDLGG